MVSPDNNNAGDTTLLKRRKHPAIWSCTRCPKRFTREASLVAHLNNHDGIRPFACTICGSTFTRNHDRKTHEITHTDARRYFCSGNLTHRGVRGCGRSFDRRANLERHFRSRKGRSCIQTLLSETHGAAEGDVQEPGIIRSQYLGVLSDVELSTIRFSASSLQMPSTPSQKLDVDTNMPLDVVLPPPHTWEHQLTDNREIAGGRTENRNPTELLKNPPRSLKLILALEQVEDPISLGTDFSIMQPSDIHTTEEAGFSVHQVTSLRCPWCVKSCKSDWQLEEHKLEIHCHRLKDLLSQGSLLCQ